MKTKLSHKDLVKFGEYESNQGYSLNQIEADFLKKGIKRKDAIKALEEIDYHKKREALKAQQEAEISKKIEGKTANSSTQSSAESTQSANKKKSSFWPWFILLAAIGIILYLYFSGAVNFDWLSQYFKK